MATAPDATPPPRVNPFVFPPDTTFRFLLLIVAVISATLFLYLNLGITPQALAAQKEQCSPISDQLSQLLLAYENGETHERRVAIDQEYRALDKAYWSCLAPYELVKVGWQLSGLALVLVVAGAIYLLFPRWSIWRAGLEPLTVEDHPEMLAYLQELSRTADLPRPPTFLWNPFNTGSGGLAFGRLGRSYVMLTGGLVQQFATDRATFRAIVLHELAHLRNGDVGKTYFAVAISLAFVLAALGPYVVYQVPRSTTNESIYSLGTVVAPLGALIYLMLAAVLRTREVYADARAALWEGSSAALSRIFAHGQRGEVRRRQWEALVSFHPTARERGQMLAEPEHLLRMGFWEAFGTGVTAAIAARSVRDLLQGLAWGLQLPGLPMDTVVALIIALLVVGVAGTGMWRETVLALGTREVPRAAVRLGLGVGLGILVVLAANAAAMGSLALQDEAASAMMWELRLLLGLILLVSLVLFFRWIGATASAWLQVTPHGTLPRRVFIMNLLIAGLGLALWTNLLLQQTTFFATIEKQGGGIEMFLTQLLVLPQTLLMLTFVSLWAIPLSAHFMHGSSTTATTSVSPADHTGRLVVPHPTPFDSRIALWAGLAGGLVFFALGIIMRVWLRGTVPQSQRDTDEFIINFYLWLLTQAAGVQLVVAVGVAGWARRLGALQGLSAAFVAACLMSAGFLGTTILSGCVPAISLVARSCMQGVDLSFAWSVFRNMANSGGVLALLTALIVVGLVQRFQAGLRLGALGGAAFATLWFCWVLVVWFMSGASPSEGIATTGPVLLAVLLQVAVAGTAALRARRWGIVHGLVAAWLTACLSIGTVAVVQMSFTAPLGAEMLGQVAAFSLPVLGVGMALALGAALVGALICWVRSRRQAPELEMRSDVEAAR